MIKPQAPSLILADLRPVTQEEYPDILDQALQGEELYGLHFKQVNFSEAFLEQTDWKNCLFEGCKFQNTKAGGSYFSDVRFLSCDLSGVDFNNSVFSKVQFQACKLTGASLFACGLRDVLLANTMGNYVVFTKSRIKNLLLQDCKLPHASFDEITGLSFAFQDCELRHTNFLGTLLKNIDLTSNDIAGAMFTAHELTGAKVTSLQACELARLLGVVITD